MRPNELKESISKITIPDAMERRLIQNCTSQKAKAFSFRKPVYAAVACILALVMLVGIPYLARNFAGDIELVMGASPLVIHAAATSEGNEYVFEDIAAGTEILMGRYSPPMNVVPGLPFNFSYPGTEIELTVNAGVLILWDVGISNVDGFLAFDGTGTSRLERVGKAHTIIDEGCIFWDPFTEDGLAESAVIEYRILDGDHIVGYGLIQLSSTDRVYSAKLVLSTGFPKVDGKYQKVTEESLQKLRQEILENDN